MNMAMETQFFNYGYRSCPVCLLSVSNFLSKYCLVKLPDKFEIDVVITTVICLRREVPVEHKYEKSKEEEDGNEDGKRYHKRLNLLNI